jgi:hypothetical protein
MFGARPPGLGLVRSGPPPPPNNRAQSPPPLINTFNNNNNNLIPNDDQPHSPISTNNSSESSNYNSIPPVNGNIRTSLIPSSSMSNTHECIRHYKDIFPHQYQYLTDQSDGGLKYVKRLAVFFEKIVEAHGNLYYEYSMI